MKKTITFAAFAVAMVLAGCATQSQQSSIAALEVGLATAESAATAYVTLPRCGGAASPVCSDPSVVVKIKAADNAAYTTLKTAERVAASGGTVSLTASIAAVTALQNIIPIIQPAK